MSRMSSSTACMPLKRAKRPNFEFCTMPACTHYRISSWLYSVQRDRSLSTNVGR